MRQRTEATKRRQKSTEEPEWRVRWINKAKGDTENRFEGQRYREEETRDLTVESPDRYEYIEKPLPKREPRIKPRIIVKENIQIRPPFDKREERGLMKKRMENVKEYIRATSNDETGQKRAWETVTQRKNMNVKVAAAGNGGNKEYRNNNGGKLTDNRVRRRPPKTVAVAIKGEEGFSYADALKKARAEISLKEIGIDTTKIRKATNGGIIIEIPGVENKGKANILVQKLKQILPGETEIRRPSIKGELRVVGFDESVKAEIKEIITEAGECEFDEISIGDIRPMRNGLYMTWVRCPLSAAVKIANIGKLKIGWSIVRAELLEARPKHCYKCWEFGHTKGVCRSEIDRSSLCFKCGKAGHSYKDCNNELHCILCAQEGIKANHRIGSFRCKVSKKYISNKASKPGLNKTQRRNAQAERRSAARTHNGSTDSIN